MTVSYMMQNQMQTGKVTVRNIYYFFSDIVELGRN
jgi:hypothetical protein